MTMYHVAEIFTSVQGEGVHVGKLCHFIRLQGCPVQCEWCDTKYSWGLGGKRASATEVVKEATAGGKAAFAVITGGEPLIQNLDDLFISLEARGLKSQVEASGYCGYKGEGRAKWTTWSPKPKLDWKCAPELLPWVNEIKWVVDETLTFEVVMREWTNYFVKLGYYPQVSLMPEGCPPQQRMIDKAMDFLRAAPVPGIENWRLSDRLQWRLGVK